MEGEGLNVYTNYVKVDLDYAEQPYNPRLLDVFEIVKGKPTMIWVHVVSKKHKPSSQENDGLAVQIL